MTKAPDATAAREVMERAIRRLGVLEWMLLALAAGAALLAGAVTAWILGMALDWPVRRTWTVASLLYFVIPGGIAWAQNRRAERRTDDTKENLESSE